MSAITVRQVYSIIRLVMITIILIYFVGCLYYFGVKMLNTEADMATEGMANTFEVYMQGVDNNFDKVAALLYFSMTTVAKIGYGDYFP